MSDAIRINKVKYSKSEGKLYIAFERKRDDGNDWDECTMSCKEEPTEDLDKAMQELVPHVLSICELPASYNERLRVSGVSFSYEENSGIMGAVITAQKELRSTTAPLVINTPHKPEAVADGADESNLMPTAAVEALLGLQDEVKAYIAGKRQQLMLL